MTEDRTADEQVDEEDFEDDEDFGPPPTVDPAPISYPGIDVRTEAAGPLPVTASKLGGVPYLAPGASAPADDDGAPLAFLAQIRCEDLPANGFLPESGLLQFWIGADDLWGLDLEDPLGSTCAVLHVEDPDPAVTAEDVATRLRLPDDADSPLETDADGLALHFTPAPEHTVWEAGVQLLQLDSNDPGVMWGDMGVGHVFVTKEQALARDYSAPLYHWDCG